MNTKLIKGNRHQDERGVLKYNNSFDASAVKRIYTIENHSVNFIRGWQGHWIEQRWFACVQGSFTIRVIRLDNPDQPNRNLPQEIFTLTVDTLDFLHIPARCSTAIQALEPNSKLLVMSDYALGEIQDDLRYDLDYFIPPQSSQSQSPLTPR